MTIKIKSILKKLLGEHVIKSAQLARATKTPPQTINNWLSGLEPRNLNQLKTVADYFEVSVYTNPTSGGAGTYNYVQGTGWRKKP